MKRIGKWLLVAGVALGMAGLSPQAGIAGVLSTSPLYADSNNMNHHVCSVVNVSATPRSFTIELVTPSGVVLGEDTFTDIAPGEHEND